MIRRKKSSNLVLVMIKEVVNHVEDKILPTNQIVMVMILQPKDHHVMIQNTQCPRSPKESPTIDGGGGDSK